MAVINNKNTAQTPIATGLTGLQAVKFIHADRVYTKTLDSTCTPPTAKSNGTTPSGWTDLGIVDGVVKISYTNTQKEVRTGIDEVLRAVYTGKTTAMFEFDLSQFDDVSLQNATGLTASQIVNGSTYQFAVGSEGTQQLAMLCVSQDKLTGKEFQFYNPSAYMTFQISDKSGELVLQVKGNLPMVAFGSGQTIMVASEFA